MSVCVFRHTPFEHLGWIDDVLAARGIDYNYLDLYENLQGVEKIRHAAGLIVMGGPQSANDDSAYLHAELRCIERALADGTPVLGVCLGSQLIAKAAGARVYRNSAKEIGWFPIHLTEAGLKDPIFEGVQPAEDIFHWHGETFDLPAGAEWLAYSERCRHQAFRLGTNVYGLQFHVEVTPEMIADWCVQDANCGDMREVSEPIDPNRNAARMKVLSECIFGHWTNLLPGT